MKKHFLFLIALLLPLLALAACGNTDTDQEAQSLAPTGDGAVTEAQGMVEAGADGASSAASLETVVDEQGAVAVSITPLNIDQGGATLDFEVALNTHSVDLSMDLSPLASLTSDTGAAVAATTWNAPRGGHHVSGVLSFPAAADGVALLEGATRITLTLENVDAPARTFVWNLN